MSRKWSIPNTLSVLRLVLVGVFVYLFFVPENYVASVIVFAVAALTDVVDGYIARKFDMITDIGKVLDPLADKLMLIAALFCLTYKHFLHPVFMGFVVLKEVLLILGGAFLYKRHVVVYAKIWGKLATLFFNTGVVLTFLANFFAVLYPWNMVVLGLAILFAVVAFAQYLTTFLRSNHALKEGKSAEEAAAEAGLTMQSSEDKAESPQGPEPPKAH